jgi:hypothetical protein
MKHLFSETKEQIYQFDLYSDWLRAKTEYEAVFGIIPETYDPFFKINFILCINANISSSSSSSSSELNHH